MSVWSLGHVLAARFTKHIAISSLMSQGNESLISRVSIDILYNLFNLISFIFFLLQSAVLVVYVGLKTFFKKTPPLSVFLFNFKEISFDSLNQTMLYLVILFSDLSFIDN